MTDDAPRFDDAGRLIAPKYDDVYFSAEDGLAETRHVFLEGNRLAERFAALEPGAVFTIGETGFGTGLNFLAAWQIFEECAPTDARLAFVSVEAEPLERELMQQALSPWPELGPQRDALIGHWRSFAPGLHDFEWGGGRISLRLLIGEAAEVLAEADAAVHAWFLDGFAPSRNPAMWSDAVFAQIARLSNPLCHGGATLATYTAAGFVRRGLEAAGFSVEKRPGYAKKRDMTVGRYDELPLDPMRAVVIGGSIAGSYAANALAERGVEVVVIDAEEVLEGTRPDLSQRVAAVQPKISDQDDANGTWLREGFSIARSKMPISAGALARSGWRACGAFHAAYEDKAERRLRRFVEQFGRSGLCRWIDAGQTEAEVGLPLTFGGVVIDSAGVVRPAGLCATLRDHRGIAARFGTVTGLEPRRESGWLVTLSDGAVIEADVVVVCNAMDATRFEQTSGLELRPVRGQVTLMQKEQAGALNSLKRALFYGGYALPSVGGMLSVGASFVPGDATTRWRQREHADVCDKLARVLPHDAERISGLSKPSGWVGVRTTTPTHRCYAEQIQPGLFVSLGHGSHGIVSAARAGAHLAAMIAGGVSA